ncbi:apolipoprotein A-II [Aplochiton taeniatus]
MTLAELPKPDAELVQKYEDMKAVFYKRLLNAYTKVQTAMAPVVEKMGEGQGQAARDYLEELQTRPQFQNAVKVFTGLAQEAGPLVDQARTAGLGLYGHYLRPHVGTYLDDGINKMKTVLDQYLPAE